MTHLNICARDDNSLRLSMALQPAKVCSRMNSYGEASIIEHIARDMQLVTNAVLSSMNRHRVMGRMANGRVKTLMSPCDVIIPTNIGNIVADKITNVNLLALFITSFL